MQVSQISRGDPAPCVENFTRNKNVSQSPSMWMQSQRQQNERFRLAVDTGSVTFRLFSWIITKLDSEKWRHLLSSKDSKWETQGIVLKTYKDD